MAFKWPGSWINECEFIERMKNNFQHEASVKEEKISLLFYRKKTPTKMYPCISATKIKFEMKHIKSLFHQFNGLIRV